MKKRVPDKFWFPWWPDKWIFGSVRIEFTPAERGIWVDMLSLASKDNGHIRANEDTPYPLQQLAGMLIIPEKELDAAIKKFIKNKKLTMLKSGTLYVTKWEKYQFSERHKRRVEDKMSAETAIAPKKGTPIINNSTLNNNKINNNKKHKNTPMSSTFKNNIIFKWNELAQKHNLAAIEGIKPGSVREKYLRARSSEKNFDFTLLIDMIGNSPFLLGKSKNPFFVFFDWVIKPTNYQKIIEGNYLDRQSYQKFSGIIEGMKEVEEKYRKDKNKKQ